LADTFDVFFSYSTRDHMAVERIAHALATRGIRVFLDRWYLTPGQPWIKELEQALGGCNAVAIFIGGDGLGRWQQRENDYALDRQATQPNFPVIPVLLTRADPGLGFLKQNTWVDLSGGPEHDDALSMLAAAIRRDPPGPMAQQHSKAVRAAVCPYRGLRPFREDDQPFFFGRTAFTETLTAAVARQPFVAVVGGSGSGKSSVVRAGLIPRLRKGEGNLVWDVATLVPGDRPLANLAAAMLPALEPNLSEVDRLAEVGKLASLFQDRTVTLRDVAARVLEKQPGTDKLLLFIDQWEELYTLCPDETIRRTFINHLLQVEATDAVHVVLTLRGDFMGHALDDRDFSERLQYAIVTIGPMKQKELADTISRPAEMMGLDFETGLAETILGDVGDEPGRLPLLEFLLEGLWAERRGNLLNYEAYHRLGRVSGAIAHRAEEVFQRRLNDAERQAAQRLLIRMVRPGEGVEDTRRRTALPKADTLSETTVQKLAGERLVVTERDAVTGEATVEVAHEALIRGWHRLRGWIDHDREFLRTRERIAVQAQLWTDEDCPQDRLLSPGRPLAEGDDLLAAHPADLEPMLIDYIKKSVSSARAEDAQRQAMQRRRLRTARLIAAAMAVLALVAIGGGFVAYDQQQQAARQEKVADLQRRQALARMLATEASSLVERGWGNHELMQRAANLAIQSRHRMENGEAYAVAAKLLSWFPTQQFDVWGWALKFTLSPDGRFLGIADRRGFRLIETASGNVLTTIEPGGRIRKIDFDRSGSRLLVIKSDGALKLIDTASGKDVFAAGAVAFADHTAVRLLGSPLSPDGRWLALNATNAIKIIDAGSGAEAASIDIGELKYIGIFFHPKGHFVGLDDGSSIRFITLPNVRELSRMSYKDNSEFFFAAGNRLFLLLDCLAEENCTGRARVIDTSTGIEERSIDLGLGAWDPELDNDGRTLRVYTNMSIKTERSFDVLTGKELPTGERTPDGKTSSGDDCDVVEQRKSAGDLLITVCADDGHIRAIEQSTNLEVARFQPRGAIDRPGGFSPDGRYVLSQDRETWQLYETATGKETSLGSYSPNPALFPGRNLLFSEDGGYLVLPASLNRMMLTDISGPRSAVLLDVANVEGITRFPDQRLMAAGRHDPFIRIFDTATGKQQALLSQDDTARPFQFTGDGKRIFVAKEETIDLIAAETGKVLATLPRPQDFRIIEWSPDRRYFIARSGQSAVLIGTDNLREIMRFPYQSSRQSRFSGALALGEVTLEEVLNAREEPDKEEPAPVNDVAFSPDSRLLAMVSPDDTLVRVIETASGIERLRVSIARQPYHVAFSPDGGTLAVDVFDNTVRLIDVTSGKERRRLSYQGKPGVIFTVHPKFSKDGRTLSLVDGRKANDPIYATLFAVRTGRQLAHVAPDPGRRRGPEFSALQATIDRFSPDSRYFAVGGAGNDPVRLFEAATGKELLQVPLGEGLKGVAFSPDSRYLAAFSTDGSVALIATETLTYRGFWQHANEVTDRAFSPDSRYFATASKDGTVRMASTESGREVARFEHGSPVTELFFAAAGRSLITYVAKDKRLRLWPTDPDWPFEQLCKRMGQNLSHAEWRTLFDDETWRASCPNWHNPDGNTQLAAELAAE